MATTTEGIDGDRTADDAAMTRRSAAPIFAVALTIQSFHMLEHVVQVVQAKFLGIKPAHGLLGSIVDHEWVHFVYNMGLYALLILGTVALLREGRTRTPAGWLWLGAALAVQSYHSIEHIVKIVQHVRTGADPAPGILGQIFDLIWLHFTFNAIVTICMVGAFVGLGLHREVAPAVRAGLRWARRPVVLTAASIVLLASVAGVAVVTAKPVHQRGPDLACKDVADSVGLSSFSGAYGAVYPSVDAMGQMMQRNMGNGAAVGDYNGDGYLDIFLLGQAGHPSRLFRNDPAPDGGRHFTDVTDQAGLGGITANARVAQFVDLSGSGRPDLVIATDYIPGGPGGPSRILRNNGDATFTDVTAGSGFDPTGYIVGGMTFADYDRSGRPSIYLSYWTEELNGDPGLNFIRGAFPGQNRLYKNMGDYHFKDVTADSGIGEWHADSFTAIFADFTRDGLPDIYQASDHRPDRFFRNLGGGQFRDESFASGLMNRKGNSMGVAANVASDGALQLYVTQITDPGGKFGSNRGNTYMVSRQDAQGIHFADDAASRGIVDTAWGWGTSFVDMNGDGAPDLYAVQGMREFVGSDSVHLGNATSTLFINDGTGGNFTVAHGTGCDVPGDQRALIVFDYNRDGAPDLLITQVAGPPILLENLITSKHWLTVAPAGPGDAGIDARVTVTAGGRTTTQIILAGGSYLAGPPREASFGLGSASMADAVRIEWASGKTTELREIPADQVLRVQAP